jgi:hypothetical protein
MILLLSNHILLINAENFVFKISSGVGSVPLFYASIDSYDKSHKGFQKSTLFILLLRSTIIFWLVVVQLQWINGSKC